VADRQDSQWGDQIMRVASVRLFGDSKRLEQLARPLDVLTAEPDEPAREPAEVFSALGIRKEPQPFLVAGCGELELVEDQRCALVRPFVGVASTAVKGYVGPTRWLLSIENLTTFHLAAEQLGREGQGLVVYTGGMPSPAWCRAYRAIANSVDASVPIYHWGDADEGGFRIAASIQQRALAGRHLQPWMMSQTSAGTGSKTASPSTRAAILRYCERLGWHEAAGFSEHGALLATWEQEGQECVLPVD
jgi:hypothetical protein